MSVLKLNSLKQVSSSEHFNWRTSLRQSSIWAFLNQHLGDYPTPVSLSYFWSFGMLAGVCLVLQLITGIILAMHYTANAELAFSSVEHIMRDVQSGWLIRYLHSNGASFFFIVIYIHIFRGLFFQVYFRNRGAWISGVIIFLLLMLVAFIGYVLPWGQMSFWGATVITNLCSAIPAIGFELVYWLWGGFSVGNATLNRFFSLHYLFPIIVAGIVILHLFFLHAVGSSNPGNELEEDKTSFNPYFILKDMLGFIVFLFFYTFFVFYFPNVLGHFDNYIEANPFVTPTHIVPEWYFLPFYAILRAIPDKLGGVISMGAAILILIVLPLIAFGREVSSSSSSSFWIRVTLGFAVVGMLLGWLGGQPVEQPFILAGQINTALYFGYFVGMGVLNIVIQVEKRLNFLN